MTALFPFEIDLSYLRSGRQFRRVCGVNADEFALAALIFEFYDPFDQREERVVLTAADILAGLPFCSALAGKDVTAQHVLAAELLEAEPLCGRVAAVP